VAGELAGVVLAAGLTRLAVSAVRAGATLEAPRPPLVTVTPVGELSLGALALIAACAVAAAVATRVLTRGHPA
jgi:hypothetical protein